VSQRARALRALCGQHESNTRESRKAPREYHEKHAAERRGNFAGERADAARAARGPGLGAHGHAGAAGAEAARADNLRGVERARAVAPRRQAPLANGGRRSPSARGIRTSGHHTDALQAAAAACAPNRIH
jgi:hypothetical protein